MSRKSDIDELLIEVSSIRSYIEQQYENAKKDQSSSQVSKIKVKSALEHLRSILDYSALDIHEKYYNGKGKIYFPYGKNEALFKKHLKNHYKNLAGKATKVYEIIKSVQSFNTEKDWLVTLCDTVNSNKHNKLSTQKAQKEQSVTLGNIAKVSGGGKIVINGGKVNGIPIAKDPNTPIVISNELTEEEMKEKLNPDNPFLSLNSETDKVEFLLDETGWDVLELITEASNGIEGMINELYTEITANK